MSGQVDVSRDLERQIAVLQGMIELAEYWINREDRRGHSEEQFRAWRALGHDSHAMLVAIDKAREP